MRRRLKGLALRWQIWCAKGQLRLLIDEQGSFEWRAQEAREQRARVEREIARLRVARVRHLRGAT